VASPTGYILRLSPDRLEWLRDEVDNSGRFAEPVREFEHSRNVPLVCFVIDDNNTLHFLASGTRGYAAGTGYRRLNLTKFHELQPPRDLSQLASRLRIPYRGTVTKKVVSGGVMTPNQFRALVDEAIRTDAELGGLLERYSTDRLRRIEALPKVVREQLAYQREAVATALQLAGIDRGMLLTWDPPERDVPRSFLDGLEQVRYREDAQIVNDLMVLPGFDFVRPILSGAVSFQDEDGVKLTVLLANRLPLEELTGADLIYYNETFEAFVMVQYKVMEREGDEAIFRLPNEQLDEDLSRMDDVLQAIGNAAQPDSAAGFRLAWNPFFLKLCPRLDFQPDTEALSHGMYIPLEKWKLLASGEDLKGKRGGRGATFENVRRHFDNTTFAMLVAKAWIGTTPAQSQSLADAVKATVASGRAAVIAVRSGPERTRW
jgi:hypothetical protein